MDRDNHSSVESLKGLTVINNNDLPTWAVEDDDDDSLVSADGYSSDFDKDKIQLANHGRDVSHFTRLAQSGELISNHVLLNMNGNLLMRQNHKLCANQSGRNFLQ